jgi:hypothetical protein
VTLYKLFFLSLLLSFHTKSYTQVKKDSLLRKLLIETQHLMANNNFPKRKHQAVITDSLILSFLVENKRANFDAAFGADKQMHHNADNSLSFYINPKIKISPYIDSVIFKKIKSSKLVYVKCLSIIVHELTHYLQDIDTIYIARENAKDLAEYISQPYEFPAYSIGAIYFLKNFDNKVFIKLNQMADTRKKMEMFINKYYNIIYPKMNTIFR